MAAWTNFRWCFMIKFPPVRQSGLFSKGVDRGGGGAKGDEAPQFLRFILSIIAVVHCILREDICIYALNNIPASPLLQTCLNFCLAMSRSYCWPFALSCVRNVTSKFCPGLATPLCSVQACCSVVDWQGGGGGRTRSHALSFT